MTAKPRRGRRSPRPARQARIVVRVSPVERATIARRAKAHKTTMAGFLRDAALAGAAGGDTPDAWWASLPATRKEQVWRWVGQGQVHQPPAGLEPLPLDLDAVGA